MIAGEKMRRLIFFGCALDTDESSAAVYDKIKYAMSEEKLEYKDPYDGIMSHLRQEIPSSIYEERGKLPVESWLTPAPNFHDLLSLTVQDFVVFVDTGGCREYADAVSTFVEENVLPEAPCLLGVDHSLSGGVIRALSKYYGKKNFSVIFLDGHFDAIPFPLRCGLISYDMETNPNSRYDPHDPFLTNRFDSYNPGSFIYYLMKEEVVLPKNVFVFGVSDYPQQSDFQINDSRIKNYVDFYTDFEKRGLKIVKKQQIETNFNRFVKPILEGINTPYVYVSVDIDVGARAAIFGARFLELKGLNENEIYKIVSDIKNIVLDDTELIGLDIMETDVHKAGKKYEGKVDRTYQIETNIIKRLILQ